MAAYVPPHRRRPRSGSSSPPPKTEEDPLSSAVLQLPFTKIYCINLKSRTDRWKSIESQARKFNLPIERWEASTTTTSSGGSEIIMVDESQVKLEWDSSINARYSRKVNPGTQFLSKGEIGCAMSHIALWNKVLSLHATRSTRNTKNDTSSITGQETTTTVLILEDDACFVGNFQSQLRAVMDYVPENWDILYLGFSDRGERSVLIENNDIIIFVPEYGFHTHAYALNTRAAQVLLDHLPVQGPLDVWLADNHWFGLNVYCAKVPNKGWQREDGSYEGLNLVAQNKRIKSDIPQSSRKPQAI